MNAEHRCDRCGAQAPRLRRLLLGRNELRRPCDRIEGVVLVSLLRGLSLYAAFFTACVAAAVFAGHLYQS